jgi:cyanophycinase
MSLIPLSKANWPGRLAICGILALVAVHATHAEPPRLLTNVVIGGAERRCSSFSGSAQSRDCTADWDTILSQDPAFKGMTRDDVSFDPEYPTPVFTYALTTGNLETLRRVPAMLFDASRKSLLMVQLTRVLQSTGAQHHLAWDAVEQMLKSQAQLPLVRLTLAEGAILRSALVEGRPLLSRKVQARSVLFSSNRASAAIATAFVAAARAANGGKTPLIGVVTAAAGPHAFVDRDINVSALQSAGAEVVYLPLEGGFRLALDFDDCSNLRYFYDHYANTNPERAVYHADLLFPDLAQQQQAFCVNRGQTLNATLSQLNGIYFSGGNQARHLESLVGKDAEGNYTAPSAQLTILQQRHAQGKLVVAGTSAGNHIQGGGLWLGKPVPMIGGGDSYDVLCKGFHRGQGPAGDAPELGLTEHTTTYAPALYPLGGFGLFRFGLLDSHFSRRAREARLIRATSDSAMNYGFGVDENTALLVSQADADGNTHLSVLGAGGVFIADLRAATASADLQRPFSIDGVRAHYLLPGDGARIDAAGGLHVKLSTVAPVLLPKDSQAFVRQDRLLDYGASNFLNLATAMASQGALLGFGTTLHSNDRRSIQTAPYYSATLIRDHHTEFRGTSAPDENGVGRASYTGLLVQFSPCDGECSEPAVTPTKPK